MSEMENGTTYNKGAATAKFLFFSIIGIIIFFVSFITKDDGTAITPLVWMIGAIKGFLSGISVTALGAPDASVLSTILLAAMLILACTTIFSFFVKDSKFINRIHGEDSIFSKLLYLLGGAFSILFYYQIGPGWFIHPDTGLLGWYLGSSVLLTVTFSGALIAFIAEFGLLEVIGTLMEPLMRPIYNVPGYAAVDGVASFVCAPAVGVFFTNKLYVNKGYTKREAAAITTNFSVCSLGFFMLICDIGGLMQYYTQMVLASFIIVFLMAMITMRIPPLSRIPDEFIDGTRRTEIEKVSFSGVFGRAISAAIDRAGNASPKLVWTGLQDALLFGVKIASYVVGIAAIACSLSMWTPIFNWLGIPFVPVLNLLGVPNAAEIAPAMLVGITEIAMPILIIPNGEIAVAASFFVGLLSTVQIIFFTESANAMMDSKIPINFFDIVLIFLVRTVIAIPLCAIAIKILF